MKIFLDIPTHSPADTTEWHTLQRIADIIASSAQHQLSLSVPESDASDWSHVKHSTHTTVHRLKRNNWLQHQIYAKWQLPRLVEKSNLTLFISSTHQLPIHKNIHQVLLLDQLKYLHSATYRKMTAQCSHLIAPDDGWLALLKANHPQINIQVLLPLPNLPMTASDVIAEFKIKNSNGADYFLVRSSDMDAETLKRLLKAYSIFKKFQRSGIQLLLSIPASTIQAFQPQIDSYKYKDDIHFLPTMDTAQLYTAIAGAYAFLPIDQEPVITLPMLISLQAGIPMILPFHERLQSGWKEQVLLADNTDKGWATQLMLIYKDETLRKQLSEHSLQKAKLLREQNTDIEQLFSAFR